MVMIGNARIAETGGVYGQAGDSTGREVMEQAWSTGGTWTEVFRPKDKTQAAKIAAAMKAICANDNVGYSQASGPSGRTSLYTAAKAVDWDIKKVGKCNCDCSSAVSVCVNAAGIPVSKDMYTGNESAILQATKKFTRYTADSYTKSSAKLRTGDILLRPGHTAVVTEGAIALTTTTATKTVTADKTDSITEAAEKVLAGKYGNGTARVKALRKAGYSAAQITKIQAKVNELAKANRINAAVEAVIAGKYGNGAKRKAALNKAGYTAKEIARIQALVNKRIR